MSCGQAVFRNRRGGFEDEVDSLDGGGGGRFWLVSIVQVLPFNYSFIGMNFGWSLLDDYWLGDLGASVMIETSVVELGNDVDVWAYLLLFFFIRTSLLDMVMSKDFLFVMVDGVIGMAEIVLTTKASFMVNTGVGMVLVTINCGGFDVYEGGNDVVGEFFFGLE